MKKVFGQTVRDIKRGVNKKVLKVPSIEQKVLDATSNEPWGPHGTHLADIAQASKNYHEYQMIMSVVWKRLNDTGKNWRHVFKALTVLDYLVANGSERVIEDIREHAYQISTLSTFQYIDSTGRDQGSNVRKKSQSLIALVNDKEKIQEAREKATASRDKLRNTSRGSGIRDEDHNGYGREREWGEDKYVRDGYGDDGYRGKSQSNDGDYGPKSQSSDGHHSSRGSNARVEDSSPDESRLEPKLSGQNVGAPPSYEDAVIESRSPDDTPSPASIHQETTVSSNSVAPPPPPSAATPPPAAVTPAVTFNDENEGFDFFDPRGASPVATSASVGAEMDLFGSLSDSFSSDALALVPSETHAPPNPNPGQTFVAASSAFGVSVQPFDDPFGDNPFRAVPSTDEFSAQPPPSPFTAITEPPEPVAPTSGSGFDLGFDNTFDQTVDILADILPPPAPSQTAFQSQPGQLASLFHPQTSQPTPQNDQPFSQTDFPPQPNQTTFPSSFLGQFGQPGQPMPPPRFEPQGGQSVGFPDSDGQFGQPQGGQPMPPHRSEPQPVLQPGFPDSNGQFGQPQGGQPMPPHRFEPQGGQSVLQPGFLDSNGQFGQPMPPHRFEPQGGQSVLQPGFPDSNGQPQGGQPMPHHRFEPQGGQSVMQPGFAPQGGQITSFGGFSSQSGTVGFPDSNGQTGQPNNVYGGFQPQGFSAPVAAPPALQYTASNFYQQQQQLQPPVTVSTGVLAIVPQQPIKEKFETKSTVWADTLNRGLVNLDISGSKTNVLSDIGIDFEAINRKEKRMEKPSKTPVTSNITMGKAMGSGSGMGRAGAGTIRPAPNPMVGPGMGPTTMGARGAMRPAPNPMVGPGMGPTMGAPGAGPGGYGMNIGQGFQMQPTAVAGLPPGGYNPMVGRGGGGYGYGQQPYGGYR